MYLEIILHILVVAALLHQLLESLGGYVRGSNSHISFPPPSSAQDQSNSRVSGAAVCDCCVWPSWSAPPVAAGDKVRGGFWMRLLSRHIPCTLENAFLANTSQRNSGTRGSSGDAEKDNETTGGTRQRERAGTRGRGTTPPLETVK